MDIPKDIKKFLIEVSRRDTITDHKSDLNGGSLENIAWRLCEKHELYEIKIKE